MYLCEITITIASKYIMYILIVYFFIYSILKNPDSLSIPAVYNFNIQ